MIFASVCSGIEAASVAWLPLGWKCAFTAEIEPFPCAVLKHHYPDTPNYGDITKFREWPVRPLDVLIGGTPCQSFSVAGLRKGLADPRGNLALTFLALAERFAPTWIVWENVPGVLSSDEGRAFGSFLGGLAAIGYGFAYTVLDAQWFGLAQRRKRVFVVGHIGGQWQRAAAVLFDRESLCGNPAPGRETGQGTAAGLAPSIGASGRGFSRTGETRGQDPVIPIQEIGKRQSGTPMNGVGHGQPGDPMYTLQSNVQHGVAAPLRSGSSNEESHGARGGDKDENIVVAHSLRADGFDASEDGTGRGTPLVPELAWALQERDSKGSDSSTKDGHLLPVAFDTTQVTSKTNRSNPKPGDPCHTIAKGAHQPAIAFRACGQDGFTPNDVAPPVCSSDGGGSGPPTVAFERRMVRTTGGQPQEELSHCLRSDTNTGDGAPCDARGMAVRRLTPTECARLQGFPDDYLDIKYRGKPACDGPKYKALGNSMATPVIRWIGERISLIHQLPNNP